MAIDRRSLTPKQKLFLDWLLQPSSVRSPRTQGEFSRQHHVHKATLSKWRSDPKFTQVWQRELRMAEVDPENIGAVIRALRDKALLGDVRAATEWLKVADRFWPSSDEGNTETEDEVVLGELSDDELQALIAGAASKELKSRSDDGDGDDDGDDLLESPETAPQSPETALDGPETA